MKRRDFLKQSGVAAAALVAVPVAATAAEVDWTTPAPVKIGKDAALEQLVHYGNGDSIKRWDALSEVERNEQRRRMADNIVSHNALLARMKSVGL